MALNTLTMRNRKSGLQACFRQVNSYRTTWPSSKVEDSAVLHQAMFETIKFLIGLITGSLLKREEGI